MLELKSLCGKVCKGACLSWHAHFGDIYFFHIPILEKMSNGSPFPHRLTMCFSLHNLCRDLQTNIRQLSPNTVQQLWFEEELSNFVACVIWVLHKHATLTGSILHSVYYSPLSFTLISAYSAIYERGSSCPVINVIPNHFVWYNCIYLKVSKHTSNLFFLFAWTILFIVMVKVGYVRDPTILVPEHLEASLDNSKVRVEHNM